ALARTAGAAHLPALLAATATFTPRELRRTEAVVVGLGRRAVPTLVHWLRDAHTLAPARVVAVRALGQLAPPQLDAILPELLHQCVRTLYRDVGTARQLESGNDAGPGRRILAALLRGRREPRLAFILELLTAAGRLAATETIAAGLRATGTKERGFAV